MPEVTDLSFDSFHDKIIHSDEPVVVEFFSHSCPHCIKFRSIFEELSEILGKEAKFFRIDVALNDQNKELAHSRGIRTVPTIEVFYRGRVVGNLVGYHHLKRALDAVRESLTRKEQYVGPGTLLKEPHAKMAEKGEVKLSLKNSVIRWSKEARVLRKQKELIKGNLKRMEATIEEAMIYTKRKALQNVLHEVRFSVAPKVYVAVEYCGDSWHIGLETTTDYVGELMVNDLPFTCLLEDNAVETEKLM